MQKHLIQLLFMLMLVASWPAQPVSAVPLRTTVESMEQVVQLRQQGSKLELQWQLAGVGQASQSADADAALHAVSAQLLQWPQQHYGGYLLPIRLQAVLLPNHVPPDVRIAALTAQPWPNLLTAATPLAPPTVGDVAPLPALAESPQLPSAPIFVLRTGRIRGHAVALLALSPIYSDQGVVTVATNLEATIPGEALTNDALTTLVTAQPERAGMEPPPNPSNTAAFRAAVRVQVSQAGMQQFAGATLIAAGITTGADLAKLQLTLRGQPVALQISDDDGKLDAATAIRFYAARSLHSQRVGDRWNTNETYWLTEESTPGLRMTERSVAPGSTPLRTTAMSSGVWEDNALYESSMAGVDGDHWFARTLQAAPIQSSETVTDVTVTVVLGHTLPLADPLVADSVYTITGSTRTLGLHQLDFRFGDVQQSFTWTTTNYAEDWQTTLTVTAAPDAIQIVMPASQRILEVRVDKVDWRRPAILNFGGNGGQFSGMPGTWQYQLANLPSAGELYDVTNPLAPQQLSLAWNTQVTFEDGPMSRDYFVLAANGLATPTLSAHRPITLATIGGADTIYLAAPRFQAALEPLLALRRQQGYRTVVVDPQTIYDAWSYGQVSPEALRTFLRYAVYYWDPAPIAAVFVGDSTTDPLNFLKANNPNVLPPYLAQVDPWLGEAPCENCFGQLDDDFPVGGPTDPDFLPDLWIGRFSVQQESDLNKIVAKLVAYETTTRITPEPTFSLYVADNYIQPNGSKDEAGDFAALLDTVLLGDSNKNLPPAQSSALAAVRVYYDPRPEGVTDPWREPDAVRARERVIEQFKKQPSLVVYTGHANHFQWASTIRTLPTPYLFGTNDIFELQNQAHLPIVLEMTCLTAQFTLPSATGTTIDERFQRHSDGGAAAVWGSAGLTVSYGHEDLIRGFHQRLWRLPPLSAKLGELVTAGYLELFSSKICCQETRNVYLLLGDPLTPAQVWAPHLFLPTVANE